MVGFMAKQDPQFLPYPTGLLRLLLRAPMHLHRLGLGDLLRPTQFLILTTKGRKSQLPRHAVLEYRRHGSKIYLVSAWGERPHWYRNLMADPCVTIQRGMHEERARATMVTNPAEAMLVLQMFRRNRPLYDRLFARMSSAETIDLRTLGDVADEFTIVKLQIEARLPELEGVQPLNKWIGPTLMVSLIAALFALFVRLISKLSK